MQGAHRKPNYGFFKPFLVWFWPGLGITLSHLLPSARRWRTYDWRFLLEYSSFGTTGHAFDVKLEDLGEKEKEKIEEPCFSSF